MTASLVDLAVEVGITYRQADHWCRRGWVVAARSRSGSGRPRLLEAAEVVVLRTMARLVHAGLTPETAARLARSKAVHGGLHRLADGVHIVLTASVQKGP